MTDQAIRYRIKEAEECSLADVVEQLKTTAGIRDTIYNTPMPMVRERGMASECRLTAVFPEEQRDYHYKGNTYRIWIPRHWFSISVDMGGRVLENRICVCPSWNPEFERTMLYNWPLGNVYQDGRVCTGTSEVDAVMDARRMSHSDMLIQNHERVLNMNCNDDLLSQFPAVYNEAVVTYHNKLKAEGKISAITSGVSSMHPLVRLTLESLSTREGMEAFPYKRMATAPGTFT